MRTSFFEARRFDDVDDLNRQFIRWLDERAHTRVHPTDPERRPVSEHTRSYDKRAVFEVRAHIDALAAEKRRASELRGRDRLRALCVNADALLDDLARRGEPLRQRTAKLNRMLERWAELFL